MLRITGCAVIFLCCTSLGMIKSLTFRERRKELENTLELIRLLEMEISYRKETLYKAFERTSHLKECWMSDVFASCAGYLRKQDTLKDAWDSAMTLHMRSCPLGRTETDVIKDISMGLGRSDTGGQAKVFTPAILRLEKCLSEAQEQELKQGRMYRGLGVAAGIVAAVIMI